MTAHQTPSAFWKRNLAVIWLSQFISMMSFSFSLPFVAYFMQNDLHIVEKSQLAFWLALFGGAPPLTMALFAPLWGSLADRFGRRIMLLRAYCGGILVLSMMGLATSPVFLIVLRCIQGSLSGTVSASQTLVASHTPSRKSGFALGALNSSQFSGSLFGAFFGGIVADYFGYRAAFFISGGLMLISFFLILFGVKEKFAKDDSVSRKGIFSSMKVDPAQLKICLPILLLMAAVMFVRQFDSSYLAILVQEVHQSLQGISKVSGLLFAVSGLAGVISGFLMGLLADRYSPGRLAVLSAASSCLLVIPLAFVRTEPQLFLFRFAMVFMSGGLEPVLQIWLCKKTPHESQGLLFGWAASFRSIGWMGAPLCGGLVFGFFGIRAIFLAESLLYAFLIFFILRSVHRIEKIPDPSTDIPPETPVDKVDSLSIAGLK